MVIFHVYATPKFFRVNFCQGSPVYTCINMVFAYNKSHTYCHVILVSIDGFLLVIRFIELLKVVTTRKDYALTVIHTSQITIGHTRSSQSVTVFTSHCLVASSNGGHSPSSGFLNCPQPQLPTSHSNSSQQLNPSGYLTNSLTHQPAH
jgi:hypothetical protein